MRPKVSLILPVYNEPKIHKNIIVVDEELQSTGLPYEIIAVNDGSDAITTTQLNSLSLPHLRTFIYAKNQGKGFALRYGFQQSQGDLICFMDSDLQLHPRQIALYIDLITFADIDIVIGSKRHRLSQVEYGPRRRLYSWGYQQLIRMIFNLNVTDTQVGLKMFKRHVLKAVMPRLIVKKWTCDLEILVVASHLGFNKILEAPVHMNWKPGKSHINWRVVLNMLTETLAIFYRKNVLQFYNRELTQDELQKIPVINGKYVDDSPSEVFIFPDKPKPSAKEKKSRILEPSLDTPSSIEIPTSGIIFSAEQS